MYKVRISGIIEIIVLYKENWDKDTQDKKDYSENLDN